jgi:hypothetical protein
MDRDGERKYSRPIPISKVKLKEPAESMGILFAESEETSGGL